MDESQKKSLLQHEDIFANKEFYSNLVDDISEGIVFLDKECDIIFANKSFASTIKQNHNDLIGTSFLNFLSQKIDIKEYQKIFEYLHINPNKKEKREFHFINKDGQICSIGKSKIRWISSNDHSHGFFLVIIDISKQKHYDIMFQKLKKHLNSFYENSPALILILDLKGIVQYVNPSMIEKIGFKKEEILGLNYNKLIKSNDNNINIDRLFMGQIDKDDKMVKVNFKTKTNKPLDVTFKSFLLYDENNKVDGVACVGIDITEISFLTEQVVKAQKMETLGRLSGELAHDFKNMLNIILGFSTFITERAINEEIIHYSKSIYKAGNRALTLTNNLLSFSRGEVIKKDYFNLNDLINEVKILAEPVVTSRIDFKVEIPEKTFILKGDSGKIHQSLLNLCLNAKDAIGNRVGTIICRVTDKKREDFVSIEIEDSGKGIPSDLLDDIFNPFFTTKKKHSGTGLGLSVVNSVIKSHGGKIKVSSEIGKGSTFHIDLPLYKKINKSNSSLPRPQS